METNPENLEPATPPGDDFSKKGLYIDNTIVEEKIDFDTSDDDLLADNLVTSPRPPVMGIEEAVARPWSVSRPRCPKKLAKDHWGKCELCYTRPQWLVRMEGPERSLPMIFATCGACSLQFSIAYPPHQQNPSLPMLRLKTPGIGE